MYVCVFIYVYVCAYVCVPSQHCFTFIDEKKFDDARFEHYEEHFLDNLTWK